MTKIFVLVGESIDNQGLSVRWLVAAYPNSEHATADCHVLNKALSALSGGRLQCNLSYEEDNAVTKAMKQLDHQYESIADFAQYAIVPLDVSDGPLFGIQAPVWPTALAAAPTLAQVFMQIAAEED